VNRLQQLGYSRQIQGKTLDVRDEDATTALLLSLAPLDHIVFSGVDKIIRGNLADANLDDAKFLFGVKFWGSVVVGKGLILIPKTTYVLYILCSHYTYMFILYCAFAAC
jgi:hypothetical protein